MRIHRLEITAFGPFPASEIINFDDLNQEGVFLLNGPTGSGKSSILDAISFALYGNTSSGRKDLNSTHADPYTQPRVLLEFSVGGRRYRIERSLKFLRPALRKGAQDQEVKAKVTLEEIDKQGQLLLDAPWSERNDEAGAIITDLLGLNSAQFNQVMILPQGKFQTFLNASSIEREKVLKQIFGSQDYETVQKILADQAKELGSQYKELEALQEQNWSQAEAARQNLELEKLADLLGHTNSSDQQVADPEQEQTLRQADRLEKSRTDLLEAEGIFLALKESSQENQKDISSLETQEKREDKLLSAWQEAQRLEQEKQELVEQAPAYRQASQKLEKHQKASKVLPAIQAQDKAQQQAEKAAQEKAQAQAQASSSATSARQLLSQQALEADLLDRAEEALHQLDADQDLEALLAGLEEAAGQLRSYQKDQEQLAEQKVRLEEEGRALLALVEKEAQAQESTSQAQSKLAEIRQKLETFDGAQEALLQAENTRQAAAKELEKAQAVLRLKKTMAEQQEDLAQAAKDRQEAVASYEKLRDIRSSSLAATLAEELESGKPCQVCGSLEHPQPAQVSPGKEVSKQELASAEEKRRQAESQEGRLASRLEDKQAELADLLAQEPLSLEEAQTQQQQAERAYAQAQTTLQEEKTYRSQEKKQQELVEKNQTQAQKAQLQLATASSSLKTLEESWQAESRLLEGQQEKDRSFSQRAQALVQLTKDARAALLRTQAAVQADQEKEKSILELEKALEEQELASAQAALAEVLDSGQVRGLQKQIEAYKLKEQMYERDSASPEQLTLATFLEEGGQVPNARDLEKLRQKLTDAKSQQDIYLRAQGQMESALGTYRQLLTSLEDRIQELEDLDQQKELVSGLAEVANASSSRDNPLKMTLQAYVLAYQLQQVALAASEHLESMSNGRYRLEQSDRGRTNQGKAGLELKILDSWTDSYRHPSSLSGGESFMASFALALGLAEIVQGSQGGVEIDTLFVDEGFGSLDDETLDTVMSTIDNLREGGRVVGLISHVTEMKTRIGKHLTLVKGPQGSTIKS